MVFLKDVKFFLGIEKALLYKKIEGPRKIMFDYSQSEETKRAYESKKIG